LVKSGLGAFLAARAATLAPVGSQLLVICAFVAESVMGGGCLGEILGAFVTSIGVRATFAATVAFHAGSAFIIEELALFTVDTFSSSIDIERLLALKASLVVNTLLAVGTTVAAHLTH